MVSLQIFPTRKILTVHLSPVEAFPDIIITFDDIIIEGNKVACKYNLAGTHKGEFVDLQPTDKQFRINGMTSDFL